MKELSNWNMTQTYKITLNDLKKRAVIDIYDMFDMHRDVYSFRRTNDNMYGL